MIKKVALILLTATIFNINAQFTFIKKLEGELGYFQYGAGINTLVEEENSYTLSTSQGFPYSFRDSAVGLTFKLDKQNGNVLSHYKFNQGSCYHYLEPLHIKSNLNTDWYYGVHWTIGDTCDADIDGTNPQPIDYYFELDTMNNMVNKMNKQDLIDILPDSFNIKKQEDTYAIRILGQGEDGSTIASITKAYVTNQTSVIFSFDINTKKLHWILPINTYDWPDYFFPVQKGYYFVYSNGTIVTIDINGKLVNVIGRNIPTYNYHEHYLLKNNEDILVIKDNDYSYETRTYRADPITYNFNLDTLEEVVFSSKESIRVFYADAKTYKFHSNKTFGEFSENGEIIWERNIKEYVQDRDTNDLIDIGFNKGLRTSDGGYLMVINDDYFSFIFLKTDCRGNLEWSSEDCDKKNISTENLEWKVYPNPVLENLIIHHPKDIDPNKIELVIYDVNGKSIAQIKSLTIPESTSYNISNLINGIYFYRIIIDGKTIKSDKFLKL